MYENYIIVGGPLVLSTPGEVAAAESQLGIRFPSGYAEYVTTLGEGVLGGTFVRIYPPRRIICGTNNVTEWRERIRQYWFWEEGGDLLTKEQALASTIVGDTFGGDELIVHPADPDRLLVLPHDSETIHIAGHGLGEAIEWLCGSGCLTEPFAERNFEPFDSRPPG